ncbi:MAG TPA: 3-hydroxyisobutyrate dehydrogenase [Aliidongia sp.]|nr:3-hydroxyisobutyrate dehydrogenase [Aliidongia sp.]
MSKIAFIGLGNMGRPMAENLVKAGHQVAGFDMAQASVQAFAAAGGIAATSAAEAVADAEVIVTMLPAGPHVRGAYLDAKGILASAKPGALLIDCSTIDVDSARAVGAAASDRGFAMIDAPVSGGTGGAAAGTLTFMVGGPDAAVEKASPYLSQMGKTIVHCGGPGTGQAAKICNNMILGISMAAVSEAFALAEKLGLDAQKLYDVSSKSSGQCWSLTTYCPTPGPVPTSPANRGYAPGFTADMMLKDLKLAQQAAQAAGAVTPLGAEATTVYQLLSAAGGGAKDFSVVLPYLAGKLRDFL